MYKKLLLLVLALMFMAFSNLRVCCRLTVDGEGKFACVDGPEFDGHLVDFDEAIARSAMYREQERHSYEATCNLFKGVE